MNKTTPLQFRFEPTVEVSAEGQLPTRYTGVCYSGGVIPGYGWFGNVAIDLSTLKSPSKPIFSLVNHDPDQRAGRCSIQNDGQQLHIEGSFLKTATGQQIASEFADEAPWEFSVGINAAVEVFDQPTTILLNGQSMTVDAVFKQARVSEVSFVPAGADPNTTAIAFQQESFMTDSIGSFLDMKRELEAEKAAKTALEEKLAEADRLSAVALADYQQELATLTAERDELKRDLEQVNGLWDGAKDEAEQAKTELSALKTSIRLNAVRELFVELGREYSTEAATPYLHLDESTFGLLSVDLKSAVATKRAGQEHLFQEQATSGQPTDPQSQVLALAADLRQQDAKLSQEQAIAKVLRSNPALYADYRNLGAK